MGQGSLLAVGDFPVAQSPASDGALRYTAAVALPDGSLRYYFEAAPPGLTSPVTEVAFGELLE